MDENEGTDNFFSRSLVGGDDIEMNRMVPPRPVRDTNRYEVEPDDQSLDTEGSPGTALPRDMIKRSSTSTTSNIG
jgi:hypothetical protein